MNHRKYRGRCVEEFHTHHEQTEPGQWIYGYLVDDNHISHTMSEEHGGMGSGIVTAHIEVDPDTVGQCSGLSDDNGDLIYEGDIIELDAFYDEFAMPGGTGYWEWQRQQTEVFFEKGYFAAEENIPLYHVKELWGIGASEQHPFPKHYTPGLFIVGTIYDD